MIDLLIGKRSNESIMSIRDYYATIDIFKKRNSESIMSIRNCETIDISILAENVSILADRNCKTTGTTRTRLIL